MSYVQSLAPCPECLGAMRAVQKEGMFELRGNHRAGCARALSRPTAVRLKPLITSWNDAARK